jgi:hypothetical protein
VEGFTRIGSRCEQLGRLVLGFSFDRGRFPTSTDDTHSIGMRADGPNVSMVALKLVSPSRSQPIVLDLTNPEALKNLKKDRESTHSILIHLMSQFEVM